jgi:hypothetical protein
MIFEIFNSYYDIHCYLHRYHCHNLHKESGNYYSGGRRLYDVRQEFDNFWSLRTHDIRAYDQSKFFLFADSGIYQAKPSKIASSGILSGFVEYNSESIYFICGAEVEVEADTETHTTTLPESYYERVELLKVHVLDGEIPVGKGFVTPQPPSNFSLLSEAEAAMVEGRSTWWIERSIRLFIHLQNVTSSNLEAFEFALSSGPCEEPTPPVRKVIIQLEKPIRAGDQAIINFTNPIPIDKSGLAHCGIVTSAWGT